MIQLAKKITLTIKWISSEQVNYNIHVGSGNFIFLLYEKIIENENWRLS